MQKLHPLSGREMQNYQSQLQTIIRYRNACSASFKVTL